ncbi:ribose-phosphate pyrophosphokinase [Pseudomonas phage Phabio]|uniref:Ribose-phosphate pyrophosphokinase n=1 Tax=Pseudomonas phage Phabio TaxID=2006668 RepID=A0A1Y0SWL4_9CAUD|nr:ribose-phosphate pyrophosphokinase [Pseudomonas phage Phabio]ARV76974.1 ribose-phosphate pyrophosphokinase [Pseudomonas phage Phabio]
MLFINILNRTPTGITHTGFDLVPSTTFKGGEQNVKLFDYQAIAIESADKITIKAHLTNANTVMDLLLLVDAIRRINPSVRIGAFIPYMPYARQDRVCNPGEALSIAVMAKVINSLNFDRVFLLDPHSDSTVGLIERSIVESPVQFIRRSDTFVGMDFSEVYLVAPDAGAQKRVKALATELGAAGYITATKERDLETMEITGTKFDGNVTGKKLLVVDDICDGGRTFVALAKALREQEPEELHLWVTHGIFSYGTKVVTVHYDSVATTNSFQPTAEGQVDQNGERDYKMTWVQL